jgi:phosphoglycerol transferase MdoB-like AlkP superfamily enzyme
MSEARSSQRWEQTLQQIQQDLLLWFVLIFIMQMQRLILVGVFNSQWSPDSGVSEYASVAWLGVRYDMSIAMYLVLPCVLLSAMCLFGNTGRLASLIRAVWSPTVVIMVILVGIIDALFFAEFHDQFNHFAFGLGLHNQVQEYLGPVLETAWSEYPLGWLSLAFLFVVGLTTWGLRYLLRLNWLCRPRMLRLSSRPLVRVALMMVFVVGVVFASRGGFGRRPIQFKDSAATSDTELNKVVPNALSALRYAVQLHLRLMSAEGLQVYLQGEEIVKAAAAWGDLATPTSIDQVTRRQASGAKIARPEHIFLIVMESADAWVMEPEYSSLHLADEMKQLAASGVTADFFVSSGRGSVESFTSILTGFPEVGVTTNYQPSSRSQYATSIASQMKEMGYTPRFFNGAYLAFQRYGDLAVDQGFEVVEGAETIRREDSLVDEWGVQDDELFDHVINRLDPGQPTFNLIVSMTYHPPYNLDASSMGYPVTEAPTDLPVPCELCTPKWLNTVGHAWYADRSLGDFVRLVEQQYPQSLFIITGDHWSRRYVNDRPPLPLIRETPLILYGPAVLEGLDPATFYGSHIDIAPTVIEMISPAGHVYHSFGRDMLDVSGPRQFSAGSGLIMGPGFVVSSDSDAPIVLDPSCFDSTDISQAKKWDNRTKGLAWWRIMEGDKLPSHPVDKSVAKPADSSS